MKINFYYYSNKFVLELFFRSKVNHLCYFKKILILKIEFINQLNNFYSLIHLSIIMREAILSNNYNNKTHLAFAN